MDTAAKRMVSADALVVFGVTGDLAKKMILPALYMMVRRGNLDVPVVGVASTQWDDAQLREHATKSIERANGRIEDRAALERLLSLLRYVGGDYNEPGTFKALSTRSEASSAPHITSPFRHRCLPLL